MGKIKGFVKRYVRKHPEVIDEIIEEGGVPYKTDGDRGVALSPDQFNKLKDSGVITETEEGLELNIPPEECERIPGAAKVGGACLLRYFKIPNDPNSIRVTKLKIRED